MTSVIESWHHRQIVSLDLETTSTDPEVARIVSATVAVTGGGQPTDVTSLIVDPGVEIPKEATDVHGISTERAREEGMAPGAALGFLLTVLVGVLTDFSRALVVFNARFDLTIMDRECRRHEDGKLLAVFQQVKAPVIDPLVIDRHLDMYRPASVARHNLAGACKTWRGIDLEDAHDAEVDALAAARLAWRLAESGRVIRRVDTEARRRHALGLREEWERVRFDGRALHAAQRGWANARAVSYAEYLERQSVEDDGVVTELYERAQEIRQVEARFWPLIPPESERTNGG
jgi:DNA polymerase-3 subunit epsilon